MSSDQQAAVLSALADGLAELRTEMDLLKASLMDSRWKHVADNFEQLSVNMVHLDNRIRAVEVKQNERPVIEPPV